MVVVAMTMTMNQDDINDNDDDDGAIIARVCDAIHPCLIDIICIGVGVGWWCWVLGAAPSWVGRWCTLLNIKSNIVIFNLLKSPHEAIILVPLYV